MDISEGALFCLPHRCHFTITKMEAQKGDDLLKVM